MQKFLAEFRSKAMVPLVRFEFGRRQVPETVVRSRVVVVAPPLLDPNLGFKSVPKPLQVQMLITELGSDDGCSAGSWR